MKNIRSLALCAILAVSASGVVYADGKTEPPVPVRTVAPDYPSEMRRQGVSGLVMVNCLVDEQGAVQDLKIEKSSNDAFVQPAMNALKKWKFKPAQKDGAAVSVRVTIPLKFSVED